MSVRPDVGLERLIHGLEQELLVAPDEEFVAGARELGMKPEMKGSAAFTGVKNFTPQMLSALERAFADPVRSPSRSDEADADVATPEGSRAAKRNADA